jgi:hypothetical protein
MRRTEMMTAGGVTLAGLGALVGLAIGSSDGGQRLVSPRAQPVEVRTQIIRRTINVYRREQPHHAAGSGPGRLGSGTSPGSTGVASAATRTRTSGARAIAPASSATPAVTTRASGSKPTSVLASGGGSGSVKTRTSGGSSAGGGSGASRSVSTRSSGGGDGANGGGRDD